MKYLSLLQVSTGTIRIIQLDESDIQSLENEFRDDYSAFILTVERKYDFHESECSWMITDHLRIDLG
ncbi:MAG: hypothetical protein HUK17_07925 [Bacteroidales bacterium]|nr:hypothetical protein [Bacteroidales bacterium]